MINTEIVKGERTRTKGETIIERDILKHFQKAQKSSTKNKIIVKKIKGKKERKKKTEKGDFPGYI